MKLYIIPSEGTRIDARHDVLGPYSDTETGWELARTVRDGHAAFGVSCEIIRSATRPVPNEPEQGLHCEILTGSGDCSNGGISSRVTQVTLLDPRLAELTRRIKARKGYVVRMWEPSETSPVVHLRDTVPGHTVAEPAERPDGHVGPMASGAWIHCHDERFKLLTGSDRPIPLHDRFETTALYRAMSSS